MKDIIVPVIIAVLGSSAVWQTVMFMIDRFDKRRKSNNEIIKEIRKVSTSLEELSEKVDTNQAVLARTHILRFADEIKNGVHHSDDYFRQTLQDCDTYERFCSDHPEFKNSYTVMAQKHIKATYKKLLEENKL